MPQRAAFLVIEGLDRSGKSTQAALLRDRLQQSSIPAILLKFPDRTTAIGQMLDAYLRAAAELDDRAVHLLFSANRWELASAIEQHLSAGTAVLCDRYAFSGLAFSAAKGLPYAWCRAPDAALPAPDLTLFLDLPPKAAKARGGYGAERYEEEAMQTRARAVFARIGGEMGCGAGVDDRWVVVDASRGREEVADVIWGHVGRLTHGVDGPVGRLWED